MSSVRSLYVVVKKTRLYKASILAKHKEHETSTENRQSMMTLFTVWVMVKISNLIMDTTHNAASFYRYGSRHTTWHLALTLEECQGGQILR